MTGCCAIGCTNDSVKGHKVYSIPNGKNDMKRRAVWISKINRVRNLPASARLCEEHFEPSQFEPKIPGKLKPNAVPTIFPHCAKPKHKKTPAKRKAVDFLHLDSTSRLKETILDHTHVFKAAPVSDKNNITTTPVYFMPVNIQFMTPSPVTAEMNPPITSITNTSVASVINPPMISTINKTIAPRVNSPVTPVIDPRLPPTFEDIKILKRKLDLTRKKLYKVQKQKVELEKKFSNLFNVDQIHYLQSTKKAHVVWSDETINKALHLRFSCGINGYNMLLAEGFPFPSSRTLRRKLQQTSSNSGFFSESDESEDDGQDGNQSWVFFRKTHIEDVQNVEDIKNVQNAKNVEYT